MTIIDERVALIEIFEIQADGDLAGEILFNATHQRCRVHWM